MQKSQDAFFVGKNYTSYMFLQKLNFFLTLL